MGHDLTWGTTMFTRVNPQTSSDSASEGQAGTDDSATTAGEEDSRPAVMTPVEDDAADGESLGDSSDQGSGDGAEPEEPAVDDWGTPLGADRTPVAAY